MPSVDELKSLISSKGGLARTNQFLVQIPSATSLRVPILGDILGVAFDNVLSRFGIGTSSRDLDLLCKTATIPGKQILTRERAIGFQPDVVAYGYAVPDVSMTFHLLNDYGVLKFFEEWKSSIINENTSEVAYKREYQRDIKIHQLKRPISNDDANRSPIDIILGTGGNIVYSVILENAFPTTIQSVELTNDQNAIAEITVQISYQNVKVIPQNSLSGLVKLGLQNG